MEIEGRPCVDPVEILPPPDFVAETFDDFMVLGMIITAMPTMDAIPRGLRGAAGHRHLPRPADDHTPRVRRGRRGRHHAADGAGACNRQVILEDQHGSSMDNLVKTSVFLVDLDDFQAMNAVYTTRVGDRPPARSTFQVAKFPSGALVEIEAVAHL